MLDTDKIIEEFRKTRDDKGEVKFLKTYPCMLGEFIEFVLKVDKRKYKLNLK